MKKIIELDDYDDALKSYKGFCARIWIFSISLQRMIIRIYKPYTHENGWPNPNPFALYILSSGCKYIKGPFSWDNSDISIEKIKNKDGKTVTVIKDENAGFELIISGGVVIAQVPVEEFNVTPENFFEDK